MTPDAGSEFIKAATPQSLFLAREKDVRHLIENGALIYTVLDFEATDKDWKTAEITEASLKIMDIGYNLIGEESFQVRVPDRVVPSPEAMLVTRYRAEDIRNSKRLPPQVAAARIFEAVQAAPLRLWESMADWKQKIGKPAWDDHVNERYVDMPGKTGKMKSILVRHFPVLDANNIIVKSVRVHEPSPTRRFMEMSYLVRDGGKFDYKDEFGAWRIRRLDKYNLGFRNIFFDNRLMAAVLFRANFPLKEIYALNKKGLGNHAFDLFSAALGHHFFSLKGRERLKLGTRVDAETSRTKISAKLDLLMEENTRFEDKDVGLPPGIRVADGTLPNEKRGHNDPGYDNDKTTGLHQYLRRTDPQLLAHFERCGQIDHFRRFMTQDIEDGIPTTHPIRFAIVSGNDDTIYRAVPLIILGSDDRHGKFNRVWGMRADIDHASHLVGGKKLLDLNTGEMQELIRNQRGSPEAIFHEVHLKRNRYAVDLETGMRAGLVPGMTKHAMRYRRDYVIDHLDDSDTTFVSKVMDAFYLQRPFTAPADDIPQPYAEEEIWTAMGDVKYPFVTLEGGQTVRLPNVIREMAQDEFKRVNDQIGDTIRALLRPQPLEWDVTHANAIEYAKLREEKGKKLDHYQSVLPEKSCIRLNEPHYDPDDLKSEDWHWRIQTEDVYATMLEDKLFLMNKLPETTRAYEVQQRVHSIGHNTVWQTIPFPMLAGMSEDHLIALRDDNRLRIRFEPNPGRPGFRFAIRQFIENGMGDLLSLSHKDFYTAETAAYVNGPPDVPNPDLHRMMTLPRQRQSVERLRQNIRCGSAGISAGRDGEAGAYEIFAAGDMADDILNSVERDGKRLAQAYPFTDKRKFVQGINPVDNRPMANVKYEVPEQHVAVKIPDALPQHPSAHALFGHMSFVIPATAAIKNARHIVLEEEKTGRRYYAVNPALHDLPPRGQGQFETFYQATDNAYQASGWTPPRSGIVLSCAELAPVSEVSPSHLPAVRISHSRLLATRAPRFGNLQRDEPLTGFIVRKYDLKLDKGDVIRLRSTDSADQDTGWEAMTRIKSKTVTMTMAEMLSMLDEPEQQTRADAMAWQCGYGTSDDLKAHMLAEFTRFDENVKADDNVLMFFEVGPVGRLTHWTPKQPRACMERKIDWAEVSKAKQLALRR